MNRMRWVPILAALCATAAAAQEPTDASDPGFTTELSMLGLISSGDLSLSGMHPYRGNTYEIVSPLDGTGWGLRAAGYTGAVRLRAEWSTLALDDGTLTDHDRYADGRTWAYSRSDSDGATDELDLTVGWQVFDEIDAWGARASLDVGGGALWHRAEVTARRKRFVVPAQTPAPGVYLGETDGVFLDDEISTSGILFYVRGMMEVPVSVLVLSLGLEGRFFPRLEGEFREVRYPDRPDLTVRRGINLSGDGWMWEAALEMEPRVWKRRGVWFLRGGYRATSFDTSGNDLEWSYIDPGMQNTLKLEQGTAFLEGGVRF